MCVQKILKARVLRHKTGKSLWQLLAYTRKQRGLRQKLPPPIKIDLPRRFLLLSGMAKTGSTNPGKIYYTAYSCQEIFVFFQHTPRFLSLLLKLIPGIYKF